MFNLDSLLQFGNGGGFGGGMGGQPSFGDGQGGFGFGSSFTPENLGFGAPTGGQFMPQMKVPGMGPSATPGGFGSLGFKDGVPDFSLPEELQGDAPAQEPGFSMPKRNFKDMSNFASMGGLFGMANQMGRQQRQKRNFKPMIANRHLAGMLGGM